MEAATYSCDLSGIQTHVFWLQERVRDDAKSAEDRQEIAEARMLASSSPGQRRWLR